jgi:hypothetical protein
VTLRHDPTGQWSVATREDGSLDQALAHHRHGPAPLPGIEDPDRLIGCQDIWLVNSPLFLTLAVRRARPQVGERATRTAAVLVVPPSLAVMPIESTFQLVTPRRLRVDDHFAIFPDVEVALRWLSGRGPAS